MHTIKRPNGRKQCRYHIENRTQKCGTNATTITTSTPTTPRDTEKRFTSQRKSGSGKCCCQSHPVAIFHTLILSFE